MRPAGGSRFQAPVTGTPLPPAGVPKFGGGTGPGGSADLVTLNDGGLLAGPVPVPAGGTSSWQVDFVAGFKPGAAGVLTSTPLQWRTAGTHGTVEVAYSANNVDVFLSPGDGSAGATGRIPAAFAPYDGLVHHYRITAEQSGGNITAHLHINGQLYGTGVSNADLISPITGTVGAVTHMTVNPIEDAGDAQPYALGHIAVWAPALPTSAADDLVDAAHGYPGETAAARIARLCAQAGVQVLVEPGATTAMGPQPHGLTLVGLLRDAETTDQGVLYEYQAGLRYLPRTARYNTPTDLMLDMAAGHLAAAPEPADDDQLLRNSWEVKRHGSGAVAVHEDTHHIDGTAHSPPHGVYDDSVTINTAADADLAHHAAWRVHLGTQSDMRWPRLVLDLAAAPDLIDAWLSTRLGWHTQLTNPAAEVAPDPVSQFGEGYTETLHPFSWQVQANCIPARPYTVAVADHPDYGRADTTAAELSTAAAPGATTLSVAVTGPLWTTDPAAFPLDIAVAGARLRVTGITGGTSPQTFTIDATPVNGVIKALPAGAVVRLWQPATAAL
jgi:hypothetical protein